VERELNLKLLLALVFGSTVIAAVLTLVSLPEWVFYFRPDWLALVVVFWVMVLPDKFSLGYGCINGLFLDLLLVKPFGLNAFGFVVLSYIVSIWSSQIKVLSLWQQSLFVSMLSLLFKLIEGSISVFVSGFVFTEYYWYSTLGNIIFWPAISIILSEACRLSHINIKS